MATRPHIIRLRAPWQWLGDPGATRSADRTVRVAQRSFHLPSGLTANTQTLLVLDAPPDLRAVRLNGQVLSANMEPLPLWTCPIAEQLQPRNRLELEFLASVPAEQLESWIAAGSVQLEIREPPASSA